MASSIPSSRCDSDRSRRVTRSMSAAEGRLRAPMAATCAWTAFSRASNARAIAALSTGFEISSSTILPSASSPCRESRSTKLRSSSGTAIRPQGTSRHAPLAEPNRAVRGGFRLIPASLTLNLSFIYVS
jgi:hypothetical protein